MKMKILSILKRISISSFHYPSKYVTFYITRSISPIINDELIKSMNNQFKFKATPSITRYLEFDETTGSISIQYRFLLALFDYIKFTIAMYNDEISYSYTLFIRCIFNSPIMMNIDERLMKRNDRFYYPIEIEGIYTSCKVMGVETTLKILDDCVLSGYINYLEPIQLFIYYYRIWVYIPFMLGDTECKNPDFVVIVDIMGLETDIQIDIFDINKTMIKTQIFNHSYVSMYLCLYEGIYYLSYQILNYDPERMYNNTIKYGFSDGNILDEIDSSDNYEMYEFNISFNEDLRIWYDEIILTDENEKYIDLYPHFNNPYTYELNRDKFRWEIENNPTSIKFNESNGRVYGNVSYEDKFSVCIYYEDYDNCYSFSFGIEYDCHYDYQEIKLFNNLTIGCEDGYYGNRIAMCVYEEALDDTEFDIIDVDNCKKVKDKPSNENEVLIIMSLTKHINVYLLFQYKESIWINRQAIEFVRKCKSKFNVSVDEISVLSNKKDLESGNVTIIIQYTTIKRDIEKSINGIESIFNSIHSTGTDFEYYLGRETFYFAEVDIIHFSKSSDLYIYIGIIGGVITLVIIIVISVIVCRCIAYKQFKEKIKRSDAV